MEDRFRKKLWDKNEKKFIEEFSILHTKNEHTYFERNPKTQELTRLSTCHIEEVDCTGLKDKDGKLIFEGDILEGKNTESQSNLHSITSIKRGYIRIAPNSFAAQCFDPKNNNTAFCQMQWGKTVIIGNIYEHSHLLEGGAECQK